MRCSTLNVNVHDCKNTFHNIIQLLSFIVGCLLLWQHLENCYQSVCVCACVSLEQKGSRSPKGPSLDFSLLHFQDNLNLSNCADRRINAQITHLPSVAFVRILAFNYDNLRGKHSKNLKEVTALASSQSTQTTPLGCHASLYNFIVLFLVFEFWSVIYISLLWAPHKHFFLGLCVLESSCSSRFCPKGDVVKLPYMREMLAS